MTNITCKKDDLQEPRLISYIVLHSKYGNKSLPAVTRLDDFIITKGLHANNGCTTHSTITDWPIRLTSFAKDDIIVYYTSQYNPINPSSFYSVFEILNNI